MSFEFEKNIKELWTADFEDEGVVTFHVDRGL